MKKLFKALLIGAGIMTAIAPTVTKAAHGLTIVERHIINDLQTPKAKYSITNYIGGLPLVIEYTGGTYGLSPKEYGIRFGNGKSRKHKSNMLLISKKAKSRRTL